MPRHTVHLDPDYVPWRHAEERVKSRRRRVRRSARPRQPGIMGRPVPGERRARRGGGLIVAVVAAVVLGLGGMIWAVIPRDAAVTDAVGMSEAAALVTATASPTAPAPTATLPPLLVDGQPGSVVVENGTGAWVVYPCTSSWHVIVDDVEVAAGVDTRTGPVVRVPDLETVGVRCEP